MISCDTLTKHVCTAGVLFIVIGRTSLHFLILLNQEPQCSRIRYAFANGEIPGIVIDFAEFLCYNEFKSIALISLK